MIKSMFLLHVYLVWQEGLTDQEIKDYLSVHHLYSHVPDIHIASAINLCKMGVYYVEPTS